jgi:flagellar motor switch protein FliM
MQIGDVIPLNLPKTISLKVDEVPILECSYGKFNGLYALCVEHRIHSAGDRLQKENHVK